MRLITVRPNLFDFQSEYTFGSEDNTTFLVYVYDFQPPLWIIISFSQHPKLDLLVSGDTSTEYDLAPTLREFCRGYGLANFRWDDIMTSIMIISVIISSRALKIRYQLIESPILLFVEQLTGDTFLRRIEYFFNCKLYCR